MINQALVFVAKLAVGKQLIGILAWLHNALDGHKSEILLGILAIIHALKIAGILSQETASQIETVLSGALPLALADRASKIKDMVDGVLPKS